MAFKFVVLSALFAYASAGLLGAPATLSTAPLGYGAAPIAYGAAPIAHAPLALARGPLAVAHAPIAAVAKTVVADDYDPNPQYQYGYDVQDALTGDSKSQVESRSGDVVQGSYSLVDPDGTRRTVEYTADPVNGFNAVVHREPLGVVAKVAAPVAHVAAAPIAARYAAPVGLASPYLHAAPIAKYGAPLAYQTSVLH